LVSILLFCHLSSELRQWAIVVNVPNRGTPEVSMVHVSRSKMTFLSLVGSYDRRMTWTIHSSFLFTKGLLLSVCCVLLLSFLGCASLRGQGASKEVIAARRMSLYGMDAVQQGKLDEAEGWFEDAVKTNPADERAHVQYGELLWTKGLKDDAITHLEKSVELSGSDANLRVRLGEMYLARGDIDLAMQQADKAIQSHWDLACAWALRGDVHRRRGDFTQAVADYHRSLSEDAFCSSVQLSLAAIYRDQNRPRRALSTLQSLTENYAPDEQPQQLLFEQGLALIALDRYSDAAQVLDRAAARGDASAELLFHLAEARALSGDPANARLALTAALQREPQHAASHQLRDRLDEQQSRMTVSLR